MYFLRKFKCKFLEIFAVLVVLNIHHLYIFILQELYSQDFKWVGVMFGNLLATT